MPTDLSTHFPGKSSAAGLFIVALIAGAALLLAHIAYLHYFYPYIIADDTFISLRYAERFLQGKGLTWNDGEYVEGYSNLLWVLLNAAIGAFGFSLPSAAQWLGIECTLLTLLAFCWHARQTALNPWSLVAGIAAFAVSSPVAIWALAGMETPMVMMLFAWVVVLCHRLMSGANVAHAVWAGVLLALMCWLRPEGPVYTMAITVALMMFSSLSFHRRLGMTAIVCLIPMGAFLLQLGFRLAYYGQWVPNSVMAKVAFTPSRLESGFSYTVNALFFLLPLLMYAAINMMGTRSRLAEMPVRRYGLFLATIIAFLSVAVILSGGDFFPCYRAFMPVFPLAVLLLMHGFDLGLKYLPRKNELIFISCIFACHLWLQYDIDTDQMPRSVPWVGDAREMGLALKERYGGTQPTIAVFAAGAIPFYSKLPSLDIFGLNDTYLTAHRNEIGHFGSGIIGHELFDGHYIASKKPDILIFDIPGFHSICDGFKDECKVLLPDYKPDILHIPGHDVRIWLRKDSKKV